MDTSISSEKIKVSLLKILLIIFMYPILVAGVYFAGIHFELSEKMSLITTIVFLISTIAILVTGILLNKKGKLRRLLKPLVIVFLSILIISNLILLTSTYFVPHKTTTVRSRFFPVSLEMSNMLQVYTKDKIILMDKSNDFFEHDSDYYTAIDHSNMASILSSVKKIEILDEDFGDISKPQYKYLRRKKDEYKQFKNEYDRLEDAYFYTAIKSDEFDTIVFLQDKFDRTYFMPYEIFLELKDIR
jgi:hypothetical protein